MMKVYLCLNFMVFFFQEALGHTKEVSDEQLIALTYEEKVYELDSHSSKEQLFFVPILLEAIKKAETELFSYLAQDMKDNNILETKSKEGFTILHYAADWGRDDIINIILETKKIDINSKTKLKATPLHRAAYWGTASTVKLLLENGAKSIPDEYGYTPRDYAIWQNHKAVVEIFNEWDSNNQEKDTKQECTICFAENSTPTALIDCGHIFCESCVTRINSNLSKDCPTCRKPIKKIQRIYL